ncbi:MAG: aminoacyl-tRNA hydrolase [Candidatus Wildermuthbacteria bacterium]|nr:aminoacyl-tRNA hydrolase [Candidatus Wildermuthbacteria bacterium]
MFLVIGLGNPGQEYLQTRHNAGFLALHSFAALRDFPEPEKNAKANALISEKTMQQEKVLLAWPQTFMNSSGDAVQFLALFYKIPPQNIIVIHDDIDLPLGTVKVSLGSGSAGHKGVESIIEKLGTKNFSRIRIGILPKQGKPEDVERFVLQEFTKEEQTILKDSMQKTFSLLETIIANSPDKKTEK